MLKQAPKFSTSDLTTAFLSDPSPGRLLRATIALGALPVRYLMEPPDEFLPYAGVLGLAWLVPIWLVWSRRRADLLLWALWALLTVGTVALLDVTRSTRHLSVVRYTLLAAPAAYVLVCAFASRARGAAAVLAPAVALTLAVLGMIAGKRDSNPDWRGLAAFVDQRAGHDDLLVFIAPGKPSWAEGYMCMALNHYSAHPQRPAALLRLDPETPDAASLLAELRRPRAGAPPRRVWIISGDAESIDLPGVQRIEGTPFAVYELRGS
jgi:hypothetical protein